MKSTNKQMPEFGDPHEVQEISVQKVRTNNTAMLLLLVPNSYVDYAGKYKRKMTKNSALFECYGR